MPRSPKNLLNLLPERPAKLIHLKIGGFRKHFGQPTRRDTSLNREVGEPTHHLEFLKRVGEPGESIERSE